MPDLTEEELKATREMMSSINKIVVGERLISEVVIKKLLEETTEEYYKECGCNTISNRCFELKGAKEILEKLLEV